MKTETETLLLRDTSKVIKGDHIEFTGFEMEVVDINIPARWVILAHIAKSEAYDLSLNHGGRGYTSSPAISRIDQWTARAPWGRKVARQLAGAY